MELDKINILLIGSGAREHALAWSMGQSKHCKALYCIPGNTGIESCAICVDLPDSDNDAIVQFAKEHEIDLVVIGPETPLVSGLGDLLRAEGIKVLGPGKDGARLEGSKAFMKELCSKYKIPTAAYGTFNNIADVDDFLKDKSGGMVVKADGVAAGKGVIICETIEEARKAADDMLSGQAFGDSGKNVIIEEFLEGEEISYFAITDGKTIVPLASAQDHKKAYDGNKGPNTGGMGAYSPDRLMNDALEKEILEKIINPTVEGLREENIEYSGVLYAGLMITKDGPKLLEYNARFGDPECQVLMLRLESDCLELFWACATGKLNEVKDNVKWSPDPAICVVMASKGYPGPYKKGTVIKGLQKTFNVEDITIFHAATKNGPDGDLISNGGRVLCIAATGVDLKEAQGKAYRAIRMIDWPEGFYRNDIGWRVLKGG